MISRLLLLTTVPLVMAVPAWSLDPSRAISELLHDHWDAKQGFPGGAVNAIAQTANGYLWIGAENGLVRFDGVGFRLFNHATNPTFPEGPVLGLCSDRQGGLWIRMQSPGLLRYHDGLFERMLPGSSDVSGVTALGQGLQGDVLLARSGDPLRYHYGSLLHIAPGRSLVGGLTISIAETPDGTIWFGGRDAGLTFFRDGHVQKLEGLPDRKINSLLAGPDGSLWVGTDVGVSHWNGGALTEPKLHASLMQEQVLSLASDRDSNIWIGTAAGLARIDAQQNASQEQLEDAHARAVNAIFEDREGNLWVGRANGIERYRDTPFLAYPGAAAYQNGDAGPLYLDADERLWFGPSSGGLRWLKGATHGSYSGAELQTDVIYSIAGGPGEVWLGRRRGGLTRMRVNSQPFRWRTYTAADGLARGSVYLVRRGRDGSIWAATSNGGISRVQGRRIVTYTTANGLLSNAVTALEEATDGTLWVATSNGLMSFSNEHWQVHTDHNGLPPARINCLFEDSEGVLWIGTEAGLGFLREQSIVTPVNVPDILQGNILGLADDGKGFLWVVTDRHVVRVTRANLLRADASEARMREFGTTDGLPVSEGLRRDHSVLKDVRGQIWFSLQGGICVVNPSRIPSEAAPAIVHLEEIAIDGRRVNASDTLRVSSRQQRISFGYIGLSLAAPESVRYRYRLDGFDHEWSEVSQSRLAVYTNLNPGKYRFRVVASNSEGIWNSSEATVNMEIVPQLWQTHWFQSAVAMSILLALVAAYRYRLHQLTIAINLRFEERLAERTRIAQELHDTLLQGFISASMQIHVATEATPETSPAKPILTRSLRLMQQVVNEGRNAVRGLRSTDEISVPLEEAFAQIRHEVGTEASGLDNVQFRVSVEGEQRPLHPLLRDEVYRIGREALINAFRHSRANHIDIELKYSTSRLQVLVRDDGTGIDRATLANGRDKHWGILGMRERADHIGARLHVLSGTSAGTEVVLDIPGHIAFRNQSAGRRWLSIRLTRRNRKTKADLPTTMRHSDTSTATPETKRSKTKHKS